MNESIFATLDPCWAITPMAMEECLAQMKAADLPSLQERFGTTDTSKADYELVDGVAVVRLEGVLQKNPSLLQQLFGGTAMSVAAEAVKAAALADDVRAVLLYIDSPGGTVSGTDALAEAVFRARSMKPVVAYVSDLAASAAYWIASQANTVYANPPALVGSIGTYTMIEDWSGFFSKAGVKVHVIRAGEFKGAGAPGSEITDSQLTEFQRLMTARNELFLAGVARGRGLPIERVRQLADGRLHVAGDAQQLGLIDEIAHFDDVLAKLAGGDVGSLPSTATIRPMTTVAVNQAGATDRASRIGQAKASYARAVAQGGVLCSQTAWVNHELRQAAGGKGEPLTAEELVVYRIESDPPVSIRPTRTSAGSRASGQTVATLPAVGAVTATGSERATIIRRAKAEYASACKTSKVLCSELAWVNDVLRRAEWQQLTEDERRQFQIRRD